MGGVLGSSLAGGVLRRGGAGNDKVLVISHAHHCQLIRMTALGSDRIKGGATTGVSNCSTGQQGVIPPKTKQRQGENKGEGCHSRCRARGVSFLEHKALFFLSAFQFRTSYQ